MFSCHQNPCRSFWIFGYPIALCCRCLGFYLGVAISSLIIVIKGWELSYKKFIVLFFIAFTDILLNYKFNFDTGNYTRFLIGIIMGFLFTALICIIYRLKRWLAGSSAASTASGTPWASASTSSMRWAAALPTTAWTM